MQFSRCSRQVGEKKGMQEEREGREHCRKRQAGRERGETGSRRRRRGGAGKERQEQAGTSIFRPSTIVPFSFSRARSASALVSNVTNPKPCGGREVRGGKGRTGRRKAGGPEMRG